MKYLQLSMLFMVFISAAVFANAQQVNLISIKEKLGRIEKSFSGKIGVYAIDTNSGKIISYRGDQRFPFQSTFKLIGVAALLKASESNKNLLQDKIHYTKKDLVSWHPITGKYLHDGMTLKQLAMAAISYSDNVAINLIMRRIGGPKSINQFAHSIGNKSFNLVHDEPNLNSNPKDSNDTATPKDMALSVEKIVLGNVLAKPQRQQLMQWMKDNTTGDKRIRAGVPNGWVVADKTGSGSYGVANDIGVVWPPSCKPIILAIYTVRNQHNAAWRNDIVAKTANIILHAYAKIDACFAGTSLQNRSSHY